MDRAGIAPASLFFGFGNTYTQVVHAAEVALCVSLSTPPILVAGLSRLSANTQVKDGKPCHWLLWFSAS